jgi:hypothetical protein
MPMLTVRLPPAVTFIFIITGGLKMSRTRYLRVCTMAAWCALALVISPDSQARADDSTCITCHTDIDLLEDNLGDSKKKKSALQAGSG